MLSETAKPKPRIERLPPLPPATHSYRSTRRRLHVFFFAVFLALPFLDIMRVDIPAKRFFFAGAEIAIGEFAILFFTLMFLMFLIAAVSIIYGRIYCGYACPQTIFSEASQRLEAWVRKQLARRASSWSVSQRRWVQRIATYSLLGLASIVLAFVFISYFVAPRDLLGRLLTLDVSTAAGLAGATVTALTFLDFAFVRQKFCTTVCPYGYLQGMLQDRKTLLVNYIDNVHGVKLCIECKKCVRDCPMGIDIRDGAYQIECIHCGECIDSCEEVLRKVGRPGLIHYAWGEPTVQIQPAVRESWYTRLGLRDAKRIAIMVVLLFYFAGLSVALAARHAVSIRVSPDRSVLFSQSSDGRVVNKLRLNLANRSREAATVSFAIEGLPGAMLAVEGQAIHLNPGQELQRLVDLSVPPWPGATDVNRFRIVARSTDRRNPETFDLTFVMPVPKGAPRQ